MSYIFFIYQSALLDWLGGNFLSGASNVTRGPITGIDLTDSAVYIAMLLGENV